MQESANRDDPADLELSPDRMQAMGDAVLRRVVAHLAALPDAPSRGDYTGIINRVRVIDLPTGWFNDSDLMDSTCWINDSDPIDSY